MAVERGEEHPGSAGPQLLGAIAEKLALAGGTIMLAAAFLVCASVAIRWATSNAIPGDFELVQIAVAISAFAFLPFCQVRRGNIMVGTFTARLSSRARDLLDALWDLACGLTAIFLAWRLWVGASETIANRTTTMVSGIPIGWAIAAASVMALLLAIAALATALQLVRSRR